MTQDWQRAICDSRLKYSPEPAAAKNEEHQEEKER